MSSSDLVKYALLGLIIILIIGTGGYHLIEGWTFMESAYMTIITLTTIGYGEVRSLSYPGRIFTMVFIILGISYVAFFLGTSTRFMVEGQIRKVMGRRKLEAKIKTLRNHYIICGYGRMGNIICKDLAAKAIPFVVVENDPDKTQRLEEEGHIYVKGDSTEEETLLRAGIMDARGLVATLPHDADNVYIVLSARELRRDIFILARADEEGSEKKLKRAGANKVISPYHIGGKRMAQAILRPTVVDFLDIAVHGEGMELQMEELKVSPPSELTGKTLREAALRQKFGVIIVAIKRAEKEMIFNPEPDNLLQSDDILIVLGRRKDLAELEKIL